ncbi:TonB-dependent receptor [Hymenobacter sp. GOD-10R]|uniref:SusC/RagA family TonB-linked outer membrane protein n=1 Tax=Hymenobacter sp. GOD-10R TaxID=3093922 RepID=UPI002D77171A|nr:TonB-dependent receptor [Hymenobacter sp. GOD-10R]WRQ26153.1 TonB-dependent receptor [Hymenobacter sp. GOD-10R]
MHCFCPGLLIVTQLTPLFTQGQVLTAAHVSATLQTPSQQPNSSPNKLDLLETLDELHVRFKVNFLYERQNLTGKTIPAAASREGQIEQVLSRLLPLVNLRYEKVEPSTYAIVPLGKSAAPAADLGDLQAAPVQPLSTGTLGSLPPAQLQRMATVPVSGKAVDEKGQGLPGVTIVVQGTTTGATTSPDGSFTLQVPANSTLVFSYIGFIRQEIKVAGATSNLAVTLAQDNKTLDDVVVIGYGTVQRSELTGAVSSVSAQQLKDIPVNSAAEALTGRLAGVQLTSSEGAPGSDVRIRVRGGGSITQDNSPLYVVDGIQIENALSVISPQDIASVDVLKDAASTAIYGARGANGVVIITTKNGIEGRTTVAYSGFAGVRRLVKTLDVLNTSEYLDLQYERASRFATDLATFRGTYGSSNYTGDTLTLARQSPFVDWQREVFGRDAFQQTHNVTVSGGGKGTVYSLSLTSNREQGIQVASDYDRKLLSFRLDNKATDKLRLGFNVRLNDQTINGAGTASGGLSSSSRLRNTVQYRPFTQNLGTGVEIDLTSPDEDYYVLSGGPRGLINPIVIAGSEYRRNGQRLVNSSGYINYNFTKALSIRSTVGINYLATRNDAFDSKITGVARQNGNQPTASISTGTQFTLNNSNVLSYRLPTAKGSKHSFDMLLGQELYQTLNNSLNISVFYLPTDITPEKALANFNQAQAPAGFVQPSPTTNEDPNRILSGFSRANYSFDDKYLVTATLRVDGSSKFREGQRVGVFPAASVAWRLSKEAFMQTFTAVSDLKLRLSYGLAGNNRIANNLFRETYSTNGVVYPLENGRTPGLATSALANPNLQWETTHSRNIGLDLALFNNRVQFTTDVYYNTTYDLLIAQPVPVTAGYASQLRNIGSTSNRGVELQLSGTVMRTPNFSWTANGNLSFNRNRVEELGGQPYLPGINANWTTDTGSDYIVQPGLPVGLMYGYVSDGFYRVEDFNATQAANGTWNYALKDGVANNNGVVADNSGYTVPTVAGVPAPKGGYLQPTPGAMKFKDINGDGVVDTNDRTVIGNANPKFTGGLNQQFTYKNFDASVFLNFVYGNDIYNASKIEFTSNYNPNQNLLGLMRDRWRTIDAQGNRVTEPTALTALNQNAKIWRPTLGRYLLSSWAIEDGSFLRVNNITVGYSLPKSLLLRAKLTQLRFYVTLNNLATWTNYSGFDPEVNTRRQTPLTPGVDYAAYPRSRGFLAGLNLTL